MGVALPRFVHGVDFSAAVDAGKKIWIASGVAHGSALRIEACRPGRDLPNSGSGREECLKALRDFICSQRDSIFGLDFPFGLPKALVTEGTWEDFVLAFPSRHPGPEAFRRTCRQAAGCELKRRTDRETRTPFSAYNVRIYRQAYYGIRDVLGPLVRGRSASVLPMQKPSPDRPWVVEICPASTLKDMGLYLSYKGKTADYSAARRHILQALHDTGTVSIPDPALRQTILADAGGDALDSVIAALAAFHFLLGPLESDTESEALYALEGRVCV